VNVGVGIIDYLKLIEIMLFEFTGKRMHGIIDLPCITKHGRDWQQFWGGYMTDPLLLTANRNCPMRIFWIFLLRNT
jgi:hypothetical protein